MQMNMRENECMLIFQRMHQMQNLLYERMDQHLEHGFHRTIFIDIAEHGLVGLYYWMKGRLHRAVSRRVRALSKRRNETHKLNLRWSGKGSISYRLLQGTKHISNNAELEPHKVIMVPLTPLPAYQSVKERIWIRLEGR